jgi:SAM-dependent methyltransferase
MFALNRGEAIPIDAEALWALTLQFQITEFVQGMTSSEISLATKYRDRADLDKVKSLAIIAMYIPLHEIEQDVDFWDNIYKNFDTPKSLRLSIEREIFNREKEKSIEEDIVSLTPVENTISEAVKNQYEHNPYPRWLSVEISKSKGSFKTKIQHEVKNLRPSNLDLENPDILIAGCGTGRHALSTANRYFGSKVMAIDLSRASLAFAMRQAEVYEQTNLNFYQADILKLEGLKERFDVIEVSGVLHHMEQPLKGWKILRNLLKPSGLMRVGLYSKLAREKWSNLKSLTPKTVSNSGLEDLIRQSRIKIIQKVRTSQDQSLFDTADFYSVSGCRDFLFHENEVQLTIGELKGWLARLNLRFLGFVNLSEITKCNFSQKFGKQANLLDLNQWEKYEDQFPNTFVTMYQFWCQDMS